MKDKIFWSLLVSVGLSVWNVAFSQRPRLDLIAEPAATKASAGDSLHVMDADGRNLRPFVSHPEYTSHGSPAWSGDGSKLSLRRLAAPPKARRTSMPTSSCATRMGRN